MKKLIPLMLLVLPSLLFCQSQLGKEGFELFKKGNYKEAIEVYNQFIEESQGNEKYYGYYYRGQSFYLLGMSKKAISDFENALQIGEGDQWFNFIKGNSHWFLARIVEKKGDKDKAFEHMHLAIGFLPEQAELYSNLVVCQRLNDELNLSVFCA